MSYNPYGPDQKNTPNYQAYPNSTQHNQSNYPNPPNQPQYPYYPNNQPYNNQPYNNQPYNNQAYNLQYQVDQGVNYQGYQNPYQQYGYQPQPTQAYGYPYAYSPMQPTYNPYNQAYGFMLNIPQVNNYGNNYNLNKDMNNLKVDNNQKPNDIVPSLSTIFDKKDIPSINQNIHQNTDYWGAYSNNNANVDLKNVINSIMPKNIKLYDDNKQPNQPGANKIAISNMFQVNKFFGTKEELDEPDKPTVDNNSNKFQNWFNVSYMPVKTQNKLDNLQELLQQSTKYAQAKTMITSGKYTDRGFEGVAAIRGFGERNDYNDKEAADFLWLRPQEFFKRVPKVFDTIDPNDILQGGLGDCYFLAAIASIANKSQRLERIFLTKQYNTEGIYVVALCVNGIWEDVVMDDRFPCRRLSKDIAFNGSKSDELWVMLLEKAWAKLHGGYLNIAAGLTREALRDLTGASAKTFFTAEGKENLWLVMLESHSKDYILTAGSDDLNYGSDAYISKIGIAGSHAYSVLGVFELVSSGGRYKLLKYVDRNQYQSSQKTRIVQIRNPWGKGEWKGDWSDNSPKWNPELKQELGVKPQDDGIFFMDFDNFCKYYSDVQVCYYHDNHKYSAIKITSQPNDRIYLAFTVTSPGLYYFSINQKNRRFFPKDKNYNYSPLSMIIGTINQSNQVAYVGSSMKQDKENWIEFQAQSGNYYVYINTPWKSIVNEFSFSVYGPSTSDIKQIQPAELPQKFFSHLLISHAKADKETKLSTLSETQVFYKRWDDQTGLGYLYFENRDKSLVADITVELANCRNIKLLAPYTGFRPNVSINPGESKIIGYEPTGSPSSCEMRIISSMKATGKQKVDMVKKEGTKMNRHYYGKDVGIYLYTLYTMDGAMYHYINGSTSYSLSEQIQFELENCVLEGNIGGYLEFVLGPGEEKIVSIVKNDGVTTFGAKIKNINYDVLIAN